MATPTALPSTFTANTVLPAASLNLIRGAFRILQVVGSYSVPGNVSSSDTTQVASGLTVTITPQYNTSKILIFTSQCFDKTSGNAGNACRSQLLRNAVILTNICLTAGYTGSAIYNSFQVSSSYLDNPATTSAVTYSTTFANILAASEIIANIGSNSSITAMEISA